MVEFNSSENLKYDLLSSLLSFTQTFYKLRTGRDFEISKPFGRESHHIAIIRELTNVFLGRTKNLNINIPPRFGKTELAIHFIAWALARYPDSNFLYVSHSAAIASRHTRFIRDIISLPHYQKLFGIRISESTGARDDFEIEYNDNGRWVQGGSVYGVGAGGGITGRGAGVKGMHNRFSGCIFIDDLIKLEDALSDTIREDRNEWFPRTCASRRNNGTFTPVINMSQRVHEHDFPAYIKEGFCGDAKDWSHLILAALDDKGNALDEATASKQYLLYLKEKSEYVFYSQYQQEPLPAGGTIFKPEHFVLMDDEPDCYAAFITVDTAETDKNYNDKTVFSFGGLHKIKQNYCDTDVIGLHWINCLELSIEPKDLQNEFMQFYAQCMRYKVKPSLIAVEKKSAGVTLLSVLKTIQGLNILDVERTKASGSKSSRFLEMQPIIASRLVSLPRFGPHTSMCIDHMRKITLNNTHRFDDIADTLYDLIKVGLIDKLVSASSINKNVETSSLIKDIYDKQRRILDNRRNALWLN